MGMWPLLQFKIWKNILFYNYFGKKKQNLGELSIYKSKYVSGKNRTHFCRYLKSLEVYCIMNWFWFAKTLFKDSLPVYERVNIDQTFQIFIWYLLCSFRQWNICYLFINLANNGSLIFWNLVFGFNLNLVKTEFGFNKVPDKYSGTKSNIRDADFPQKYLAALIVNHFHKMLYHRHLTGPLIRLSERKLKCCSARFVDGKKASYSFHSLYYSFFLVHSQRYFKF